MPPSTAGSEFPPSSGLPSRASEADVTEELNMESDMAQENADRALKSVADKLDKSLSVEYTVNRLINEARDTWNLSQIYSGVFSSFLRNADLTRHSYRMASMVLAHIHTSILPA
ncbi:hypothetical protein CALCODRAFT_357670 [Calocera cornea HHB12733]|uniref:FATC domain-containing protein n=1 Tax=Calocera cornea HHB12733 TaxID=1353952 RepID=A0A165EPA9_9BASI|nr:hypothetical protein CALCODRAFT_357670 [Calocera cornea HHB12733]